MITCREFCAALETFVDGELPVERAVDAEWHISTCRHCAERVRFERALRSSIKHVVRQEVGSTAELQQRLARVLVAERTNHSLQACTSVNVDGSTLAQRYPDRPARRIRRSRELNTRQNFPQGRGAMQWRTLLPLAAVAAGAILYAGIQKAPATKNSYARTADVKLSELDSYLDLMVSRHQAARHQVQPIQFSHEERLEPPYHLPPIQDIRTVEYLNSAPPVFRGTSSAYQVRGHRVTFFAYEATTAPLRARLEGYSLRGRVVYAGKRQGYSVATVEEGPVGYAMASDLTPQESAEVIASAVESRVQH
jgi:hypothetical protein